MLARCPGVVLVFTLAHAITPSAQDSYIYLISNFDRNFIVAIIASSLVAVGTTSEGVKVSLLELTVDCFYYCLSNLTVTLNRHNRR